MPILYKTILTKETYHEIPIYFHFHLQKMNLSWLFKYFFKKCNIIVNVVHLEKSMNHLLRYTGPWRSFIRRELLTSACWWQLRVLHFYGKESQAGSYNITSGIVKSLHWKIWRSASSNLVIFQGGRSQTVFNSYLNIIEFRGKLFPYKLKCFGKLYGKKMCTIKEQA